jgi:hypothetical protein
MYTKQLHGPNEGRITLVEDDRDARNHITLGYAEESSEAAFKKQEKADAAKAEKASEPAEKPAGKKTAPPAPVAEELPAETPLPPLNLAPEAAK